MIHELPERELACECGCHVSGEEVSEQLEIVPMQIRVIRHVGQRLLALGAGLGLLLLAPPAVELGSMQAGLFGSLADANSLGQSQRFVLMHQPHRRQMGFMERLLCQGREATLDSVGEPLARQACGFCRLGRKYRSGLPSPQPAQEKMVGW